MKRTVLLLIVFALSVAIVHPADANPISWAQTNVPFGGYVKTLVVNSSG